MKRLILFTASALTLHLARCDVSPFADLAHSFAALKQDEFTPLVPGNATEYTDVFGLSGALVKRQRQCQDAGYVPCPNMAACCPAGDDCFANGCCRSGYKPCGSLRCYDPSTSKCCADGTSCKLGYDCVDGGCCPSGQVPCGTRKCYDPNKSKCCGQGSSVWGCPSSDSCCGERYCYNPSSERCCDGGSCPDNDSCCTYECCRSIAYCASNGYCSACPAATRTRTTTKTSVWVAVTTRTVTRVSEPTDASGFSCPAMTATNSEGATLELADDCALSYTPPEPTSTGSSGMDNTGGNNKRAGISLLDDAPAAAAAAPLAALPRQLSCTPYSTVTRTVTASRVTTSRSTTTTTTYTEPDDFSCAPMSATNARGDVLALNDECQFDLQLATTTANAGGGGPPGPNGSGQLGAPVWKVVIVAVLGLVA